MKPTVVFILSDKRSGSTFLERELARHPLIQHVAYTPHTYNETHYWVKAARLLEMPEQLFSGEEYPGSYGGVKKTRDSLITTIKGNVADFVVPDDDRELVFKGWDALCAAYAKPVFIEKSPHHIHNWAALELMLEWMGQTDTPVLFIGLIRNPMSVMYSAFQLFGTDPAQRQFGWMRATQNLVLLERLLGEEAFRWVRYENLVEQPEWEFSRLCEFIGVDFMHDMGASAHTKSKRLWEADPVFRLQLDPAVKRLAICFGYSQGDLHNPQKPELPLSKRIQHRIGNSCRRYYSRLYNLYKRMQG